MTDYKEVITAFVDGERERSRVILEEPSDGDFEGLQAAAKELAAPVTVTNEVRGIYITAK